MKVSWANLKNQNKYSFIDKKKHKDGVTDTVKLTCGKDVVAAAVCLSRTSAVTIDFNHPSKGYINYISTDLSAEMMSTQNDGQNSDR